MTGATIRTMDSQRPLVEAVGIDAGTIAAVGPPAQVREAMGEQAHIEDLGGGALLPGFIDAHHHLAYAALDYGGPSLRLPPGSRLEDLLTLITEAVAAKPPGWVYLCGYEVGDVRERRAPRADELEQCCPGRPLFVQAASGHDGALNHAGLDAIGWTASSQDPANGVIVRDRRGRPTGVVSEAATCRLPCMQCPWHRARCCCPDSTDRQPERALHAREPARRSCSWTGVIAVRCASRPDRRRGLLGRS